MDKAQQKFFTKFGAIVRRIRLNQNRTLEDMQDDDFSAQHFQKLESGQKAIGLWTAYRIAKAFKVSLSELLKDIK